jgi:hypothetical protein
VQQGARSSRWIEISGRLPEEEVRDGEGRSRQAATEIHELLGVHQQAECEQRGEERYGKRRQNAADASLVELSDGEPVICDVVQDSACNDKSGDDEEDVNPDIAAGNEGHPHMIQKHRQHCDRPQSVDVGPVLGRRAWFGTGNRCRV